MALGRQTIGKLSLRNLRFLHGPVLCSISVSSVCAAETVNNQNLESPVIQRKFYPRSMPLC